MEGMLTQWPALAQRGMMQLPAVFQISDTEQYDRNNIGAA